MRRIGILFVACLLGAVTCRQAPVVKAPPITDQAPTVNSQPARPVIDSAKSAAMHEMDKLCWPYISSGVTYRIDIDSSSKPGLTTVTLTVNTPTKGSLKLVVHRNDRDGSVQTESNQKSKPNHSFLKGNCLDNMVDHWLVHDDTGKFNFWFSPGPGGETIEAEISRIPGRPDDFVNFKMSLDGTILDAQGGP